MRRDPAASSLSLLPLAMILAGISDVQRRRRGPLVIGSEDRFLGSLPSRLGLSWCPHPTAFGTVGTLPVQAGSRVVSDGDGQAGWQANRGLAPSKNQKRGGQLRKLSHSI